MAVFSLADFFDKLNIVDYTIYLADNGRSTQTNSGITIRSVNGPRLWTGSITLATYKSHAQGRGLEALCQHVQSVGNHFLVRSKKAGYPASRVAGDGLTNTGLTIVGPTVGTTATLAGLPANYVLTGGDYFSYSVGGVFIMHQIALGATANGSGTVTVTLVNPITAGFVPSNGASVQLVNPRVTAQIAPGTLQLGSTGLATSSGLTFNWVQSLAV